MKRCPKCGLQMTPVIGQYWECKPCEGKPSTEAEGDDYLNNWDDITTVEIKDPAWWDDWDIAQ